MIESLSVTNTPAWLHQAGDSSHCPMKYPALKRINGSERPENVTQLHSHRATQLTHATQPFSHSGHRSTDATYAIHDSAPARFDTLQRAARVAIETDMGENCCWTFARAVKAFEKETKPLGTHAELCVAFNSWWLAAKELLPPDADYHEYRDDFLNCYQKVISPLGENALEAAKLAEPTKADLALHGPKKAKLVALCRALQRLSGKAPFFLGVRHAAEAMGTQNLYTARNALNALAAAGVLVMEQKGQLSGRKATRYRFIEG